VLDLDSLLTFWQCWRHAGENILVSGLVIEAIALFFHDNRTREKLLNGAAILIIIVGLITENVSGGRADDVIRRMRAPRGFTAQEHSDLVHCLRRGAKGTVFVVPIIFNDDAQQYSEKIIAALNDGGIDARPEPPKAPAPYSYQSPGAFLFVKDPATPHAVSIYVCFKSIGFDLPHSTKVADWAGESGVVIGVGSKP